MFGIADTGTSDMTPAQDEALNKIKDIIREHFEAGVISIQGEDDYDFQWHGGISTALGLLDIAHDRLMRVVNDTRTSQDEDL